MDLAWLLCFFRNVANSCISYNDGILRTFNASIKCKVYKGSAYCKKVSLPIAISGIIGVIVAVKFFKGLPIDYLKLVVIVFIAYTSSTMVRSATKKEKLINN